MAQEYMSLETAAEKWHSQAWYIRKACEDGQIPGAAKLDGNWIIPQGMERPPMHIPKSEPEHQPIQHGSLYKGQIYRMTMKGFPDFNVVSFKDGNTTFYFSACNSPDATQTFIEKMLRNALRVDGANMTTEDKKDIEIMMEAARDLIPSDDQLREYYLKKFTEIGFNDEEISVLMAKIEEHIQTRKKALARRK